MSAALICGLSLCFPMFAQTASFAALADQWSDHFGVARALVRAVIEAESNWNVRAVSPAGAVGLMQLMPETASAFGVRNRFDAAENIRGGVAYLAFLLERFDGDLRLAVAAYNAGHGRIGRAGLSYRNPETVSYTRRVAYLYQQHRRDLRK
jgi:soluble lytic murein transglycosylase-like protein